MKTLKTDGWVSIEEIVRQFDKDKLHLPPWQREFVWDDKTQKKWMSDLDELVRSVQNHGDQKVIGCITTFSLKQDPSTVFLNDGGNRVRTSSSYLKRYRNELRQSRLPDDDSHDSYEDTVRDTVGKVSVYRQHFEYDTAAEACQDFMRANIGTTTTPRELCRGILATGILDYKAREHWLSEIHKVVQRACDRINCVRQTDKRENRHKQERDILALFLRFGTGETHASSYDAGQTKLSPDGLHKVIEAQLVPVINGWSDDELESRVKAFMGVIDRSAAMIQKVSMEQNDSQPGKTLSETAAMWLLHFYIYAHNKSLHVQNQLDFTNVVVKKLFSTNSSSTIRCENSHATLTRSKLDVIHQICEITGFNKDHISVVLKYKKRKRRQKLAAGFDHSHVLPFSTHGEGETFPEPASVNRARGANPVLTPVLQN